jgi:hypothetical protein
MWALIRLAIYLFQVSRHWLSVIRSQKWPRAEATVTAEPAGFRALARYTVEVPYTYHFQGELYTGLHEEPSFGGVGAAFLRRFAGGRRFIVRVKPGEPEVSVMREGDQADDLVNTLGN